MHRFRSWTLDPPEWRTQRNRILAVEGGDGSTLSLDFTTGILDPRLTFTRGTNATFINSQGYVEWANSNMYWNTAFEGLSGSTPSLPSGGWNYALSTGGTAVFNGDGTVTVTTTAAERRAIFRSSGFSGGGLRVVASVDVTIASGSLQASQVIVTGTPANAQHYVNGVIWNSSHPIWNGGILPVGTQFNIAYATDSQTSSTTSIYFGVGCTSAIAGSATFSNPRWTMWKGSATVPYYPNTSATNNSTTNYFKSNDYQAPRFNYDPTTLTPRGLLLEAQVPTLNAWSEDFTQSYWNKVNTTIASTSVTCPDNIARTTVRVTDNSTNAAHTVRRGIATTAGSTYTISWFVKKGSTDTFAAQMYWDATYNATLLVSSIDNNTQTVTSATNVNATVNRISYPSSGWFRYVMTFTHPSATGAATPDFNFAPINNVGAYVGSSNYADFFGIQLETGSGASSYIPTGASTGSRAKDVCNITGSNFSSWFVDGPGTIVAQSDNVKVNTRNLLCEVNKDASNYIQMGVGAGAGSGEALLYNPNGFSQSGTTPSLNTAYKSAYVWDTNYFKMCLNGTLGSADTTGNIVSSGMVNLSIGGDLTNPTDVYIKNGHIRLLKYWPTRLPDAQLQALTTG